MKRKLEERGTWRLEKMMAIIDHLSPTVLVDQDAILWDAISVSGRDKCIEWIDRRLSWPDILVRLRKSISRYWECIEDIRMVVDLSLRSSSTVTMADGTPVTDARSTYTDGTYVLTSISLMRMNEPEVPVDLIHQIRFGNVDEVRRIVENGVNVNVRAAGFDDGTPLGAALLGARSERHAKVLQYLVSRPDIDVVDTDYHGNTLLHRIITMVDSATLLDFMHCNVNTHLQNKLGRNVLHELIRTHRQSATGGLKMATLLDHGSGTLMFSVDNDGRLPLDFVTEGGDLLWQTALNAATALKLTTVRELTAIVLSFVPVLSMTTIVLEYYTITV
jgi:hypothetical protein